MSINIDVLPKTKYVKACYACIWTRFLQPWSCKTSKP